MNKNNSIIFFLFMCLFITCEDVTTGPKKPEGSWNANPITDFSVIPINGGAEIIYTIPDDPEIMYVMAEYERNGKIFTEKASVHKNKLTIEGFHKVDEVKVELYQVNRYEQRSEPVEVVFKPLESLIDIAYRSLELMTGFGGIVAQWENPEATELGVRFMTYDDSLFYEFTTQEMYFTTKENEKHSFRGFEAVETTFALSFEDKWGNVSDTVQFTTIPYFETLIEKPYVDFREIIPYDNTSSLPGFNINVLWDNIVNTPYHGWLTNPGSSGLSITIDIKQVAKLSRIIHHFYHSNEPYYQVNISEMEIWGIDKIDEPKLSDKQYWLDSISLVTGHILNEDPTQKLPERTFKDDWQYLGYHSVPFYDVSTDRLALAENGAEYEMPIEAAPVRYIRIFVRGIELKEPRINNYFSMGEITFYGDNTVSQE